MKYNRKCHKCFSLLMELNWNSILKIEKEVSGALSSHAIRKVKQFCANCEKIKNNENWKDF